jgi:hypothetical protein
MQYTVEMGSSTVMYIPRFIKIGSGIQKLIGGGFTGTEFVPDIDSATY